jgi:hypothetical protein
LTPFPLFGLDTCQLRNENQSYTLFIDSTLKGNDPNTSLPNFLTWNCRANKLFHLQPFISAN